MTSCVDRLLSINNPCGQSGCTGIYDITDVIGFTWNRAADIAEGNFKEYTGYQIAHKVRRISAKTVMADLMADFQLRGWATNLTVGKFNAGQFKTNIIPGSSRPRGIQLKAESTCVYSGLKLRNISVAGATDLTTDLHIDADGIETVVQIELKANKILTLSNVCGSNGQSIFSGENRLVTIWIEDENFRPIEVKPNCPVCMNGKPDPCATSYGWTNTGSSVVENKSLAYGITAEAECECNYDRIICSLPNDEFKAQLMKYQASIQFARLALETERFNYFTIYGREELQEYIAIAQNGYRTRIKQYVDSLHAYFQKNKFCGCISCEGSKTLPLI